MTPEIQEKIKKLQQKKDEYRHSLHDTIFSDKFYNWLENELLGEPNFTEEKLVRMGVPRSDCPRILKQERENAKKTFAVLMENLAVKAPYSTEFLKGVHRSLMQDIIFSAGEYRTEPVRMAMTAIKPAEPYDIHGIIEQAQKDYYADKNEVKRILDLNYKIVVTQPFFDANKRTSRITMNYELLRHGYSPVFLYGKDRADYLDVIEKRFATGETAPYYNFMLGKMAETTQLSIDILDGKKEIQKPVSVAHQTLAVAPKINNRQKD